MKRIEKILLSALALCLGMLLLAGCGGQGTGKTTEKEVTTASPVETTAPVADETTAAPETEPVPTPVEVRVGGLKGPTTIGLVKLLDSAEKGQTVDKYDFTMAAAADELTPKLLKGELDVAALPLNLCSVLYNNSNGGVRLAAVNTLGVVYVVEKGGEEIKDLSDLKGRTVYATGKGTTPEYALSYLLSLIDLDIEKDVDMVWMSEPTEVVSRMAGEEHAIAMMPQPFVTVASGQLENFRVALDLTAVWDSHNNGSTFITAGLLVRKAFAEEHPEALARFLTEYAASVAYVNESVADAAVLVEKYGIVAAKVAEKAIPACHVVCITGETMKTLASGYLNVLSSQNAKAVGGAVPADDFYYIG